MNNEMQKQIYEYIIDRIVTINEYLEQGRECPVTERLRDEAARDELLNIAQRFYGADRIKLLTMRKIYSTNNILGHYTNALLNT
jgi:ligand-binding sensor protein